MPVTRTHRETDAAVKLRRAVEIVDGMDDMVEPACHKALLPAKGRAGAS
jgi:hypothetical protein